jgi:hypothetical protein
LIRFDLPVAAPCLQALPAWLRGSGVRMAAEWLVDLIEKWWIWKRRRASQTTALWQPENTPCIGGPESWRRCAY